MSVTITFCKLRIAAFRFLGSYKWGRFCLIYMIVFCGVCSKVNAQNQNVQRPLDIVFCADLSGSTNGLINDMRDQLWVIVNQIQQMEPAPDLRISFVGFSRPSFGKNTGYVKIFTDLTPNFDFVAARMYTLKPSIEKGDQIVHAALNNCITQLNWSKRDDAVKIIFLIGNGMVAGANFEYVKSCEQAAARNIIINTIYVQKNNNMFKELPGWRRIATITRGMQSEITVNKEDDITTLWSTDLGKVKDLHKKLVASFIWNGIDSSLCRKYQFSADSGAWEAGKDVYLNRVFYQLTDQYASQLRPCELVSEYTAEGSWESDTTLREFRSRLTELKKNRDLYRNALKEELTLEPVKVYHQLYVANQMTDKNIFHRVVLNMLLRQWK